MYVKNIHVNQFRHLEDVHLGPFAKPPDQSDLIVLAGPNGGGKSSILELLSFALSNSWSLSYPMSRSFPSNSFEVAIAVTQEELSLIHQYIEQSKATYQKDILEYFDDNCVYYRAYNYAEGKYQENATLYNNIHNLVTQALRNHYSRSLGFFLRSDRSYPREGFRRERLFSYDQINQRDYIWGIAFNTSDIQYKDMFEFLVQQRYHYFHRLGVYHHRLNSSVDPSCEKPSDPLKPYDELLQKLFPEYRFTDAKEKIPSNLFIRIPSGEIIPFSDLSSGEKEVFFILSFFLRHNVNNAVIVIDEPELHLHPELARLLVRTMRNIKPNNQIWLATHNTEIIDEAGRDRVYYIARNPKTNKSVVTPGTDEPEAMRQIKDLFGYSGYVGIARSMVFLEGIDSSSDRKIFSTLFPEYGNQLKFVPCGSSKNLPRINNAILSIMESNLGWMDFYLIRDRDYLTEEFIKPYSEHSSGRIYVLKRHEIENYLLDEHIISKVQDEIFNSPVSPKYVKDKLKSIAINISGEVFHDMLAYRLNLIYRSNEDFSLGRFLYNQSLFDESGNCDLSKLNHLKTSINKKSSEINNVLLNHTKPEILEGFIYQCRDELKQALLSNTDGWRYLFPGKRLLEAYSIEESLGKSPILQNNIIKELSLEPEKIPSELNEVIRTIVSGERFSR